MSNKDYETVCSEIVFEVPYFNITEEDYVRHDGESRKYWVVNKQPSVFIVPISDSGEIYLIKQFRYPTKTWGLELPAGSTDGEDSLVAAKRELQEETGFIANEWEDVGDYLVAPGLSTNVAHIYVARGLVHSGWDRKDEEGITEVVRLPLDVIKKQIRNGEIKDGPSIAVLARVFWK